MARARAKKKRRVASIDAIMEIEDEPRVDLLDGLNDVQRQVLRHEAGPAIVCSVAGSGKTEVVTRYVARRIQEGTPAERICAVTFTRKAAGEMNARAKERFGVADAQISTFHSLCLKIVRENPEWADFEVDEKKRMDLALKQVLGWQHMDWKGADLTEVKSFIGACKNGLVAPEDFPRAVPEWFSERYKGTAWLRDTRYAQAYYHYEEERLLRKLLTFDDMLCSAVRSLWHDDVARSKWAHKYDYVIVDEFQDSNHAQYELMKILATHAKVLLVVGDDDQLIYRFRGSVPEFTTGFDKAFGAAVYKMNTNYRSTPEVLDAANKLIAHNEKRIVKVNQPTREPGVAIEFEPAEDMDAEAEKVAEKVAELREDGAKYSDMAVLYRTNAQSRPFEEVFISRKIPHIIVGGVDFYRRKEVADILAYLRVAVDESDDKSCQRAINRPFRYIGKVTLAELVDGANSRMQSMFGFAAEGAPGCGIKSRQAESIAEFVGHVRRLQSDLARPINEGGPGLAQALSNLVANTRYEQWLITDEGTESAENSRLSNLRELVRTAGRFATAAEFLDYIAGLEKAKRSRKKKQRPDAIQVMTCHKAKGLEFPVVFLAGCAEKILPHARAEDVEEERRIMYVGITRARDRLFVSYPKIVLIAGKRVELGPSRFLKESGILNIESV